MESLVNPNERHYSPNEVAEMWGLDSKVIRNLFKEEAGVVRIGNAKSTYRKRAHTTLRIPESVLHRVHRRLQVKN